MITNFDRLRFILDEFFLIDDVGIEEEEIAITVDVEKLQKTLIPHHYEEDIIDIIDRSM